MSSFDETQIPDLTGYTAIVTGGNSGIGLETTRQLALHNAKVYIASRSAERVAKAIEELRQATDKNLDLHFLQLDLLNLESVKVAAQYFASVEDRLDILVNNAGIMNAPFKITDDGYESQWQANYVAPHVFTAGLLDLMLATAAGVQGDKTRVRIVNVASDLAFYGPKSINFDDPNMSPGKCEGIFDPQRRYSHSKQALLRETAEITERYASQGVTAYSLHPGIVKSGLQDSNPNVLGSFTRTFVRFSGTTTLEAAYNSLFAATSPQAPEYAGKYLKPVGKLDTRCEAWVSDKETNRKLWEVTERRTKQMPLRTP